MVRPYGVANVDWWNWQTQPFYDNNHTPNTIDLFTSGMFDNWIQCRQYLRQGCLIIGYNVDNIYVRDV